MDALVKSLEKRGFSVTLNEGKVEAVILEEPIVFSIFESTKRYELVVTPEMRKKDPYKYYQKYGYNPSGIIELKIDTWSYGARSTFRDRKNKLVDNQLNDFIVCMIEAADRIRQREDQRKREAEEWRKQREKQAASKRQEDQEKANRKALLQSLGDWQNAQRLREFISAVEKSISLYLHQVNWQVGLFGLTITQTHWTHCAGIGSENFEKPLIDFQN